MKIPSTPQAGRTTGTGSLGSDTRTAATARKPATTSSTSTSDTQGASAARMNQLEAQFSQSDFNAQKVQDIQSAIAQGKFQVNSGAIADKLISNAAELAGAR